MTFPITIAIQYICLLFSLCVHEAAHAAMANFRGDPSARLMGRMTLNPLAHIDPIGTVVFPLLAMITQVPFLFGWAKPVPFNPRNLKDIHRDPVWISLAGPGANFLTMLVATFCLRIAVLVMGITDVNMVMATPICMLLVNLIIINLVLMLFNCIPVPPLDGHHVLHYFLPPSGKRMLEQIGPFGILIAIFIARPLISPPLMFMLNVVLNYGIFGVSGFIG